MDESDEGGEGFREVLEVLGETPVAPAPGEGPDGAAGLDLWVML